MCRDGCARSIAYAARIIEPLLLRFDAGSLPVGQLVLDSKEASIDRLQDLAY